jgi:hypothetical protein
VIFVLGTFVVILSLVLGAYWLFVLRLEQSDESALRKRLQPNPVTTASKGVRLLKPLEQLSNVEHLNSALGRMNRVIAPLQRDITQAGLT